MWTSVEHVDMCVTCEKHAEMHFLTCICCGSCSSTCTTVASLVKISLSFIGRTRTTTWTDTFQRMSSCVLQIDADSMKRGPFTTSALSARPGFSRESKICPAMYQLTDLAGKCIILIL